MKLSPAIGALAFFAVIATSNADPSASSTPLPLSRVTLYSSGVGFFERRGEVSGDANVPLSFTVDQINDVLKSLVLLDYGGGSIDPITYSAQDPVARELQAYSIDLSDNPSQSTLLSRLRGEKVTLSVANTNGAETSKSAIDGTITSVETTTSDEGSDKPKFQRTFITLFCDDNSFRKIDLATVGNIQIDDPDLNKEIGGALAAIARSKNVNKRSLDIAFHGKGKRQVYASYVIESPVWKTSYRILLGEKPVLQGWGIVENTSSEDWNNVALTLVSGRPISFVQDLYAPYYIDRPKIELQIGYYARKREMSKDELNYNGMNALDHSVSSTAATRMLFKDNNMAPNYAITDGAMGGAFAGKTFNTYASPIAPTLSSDDAQNALLASWNAGGSKLGESLFKYSIMTPVSIPRGQSAMIPFLSSPIEAKRVAVYNETVNSAHPLTGARIHNTTGLSLKGGAATVLDGDENISYSGDALLADLQPNETKLITYALDLPVDATVPQNGGIGSSVISYQLRKGVLNIQSKQIMTTKYVFKNKSNADQTIVVEKPSLGDDWTLIEPEKNVEKSDGVYRFDVLAPAGKETGAEIKFSRINWEAVRLADQNIDSIGEYARNASISPKVKAALEDIAHLRAKVASAQAKVDGLSTKIKQIEDSQNHIRENMKELSRTDSLYLRYVKELSDQETKYEDLTKQRETAQTDLDAATSALNDYMDNIVIGD